VKPAELVVRRSRLAAVVGAFGGAVFALAAGFFLLHAWREGESTLAALFLFVLALAYAAQTVERLLRDRPVLAIRPDGLHLPACADRPIAWRSVRALGTARGPVAWRGGRVDVALEPEAFARLRPGQRLLGDAVTKLRFAPNAISIHASGLDHDATQIVAALSRHWPPADAADAAPASDGAPADADGAPGAAGPA
jgi:hypothetical protein